jgi:hypothetical protein
LVKLTNARSRWFSTIPRRTRIAQIRFGFNGRFCPMIRPLFQARRSA